jgi:hypothetical protein
MVLATSTIMCWGSASEVLAQRAHDGSSLRTTRSPLLGRADDDFIALLLLREVRDVRRGSSSGDFSRHVHFLG